MDSPTFREKRSSGQHLDKKVNSIITAILNDMIVHVDNGTNEDVTLPELFDRIYNRVLELEKKCDNSVTEFDVVYKNEKLGHGYGVCETDEGTDYEVGIDDFILKLGGIVVVKFDNDVPAEATLNISETGAKPIYCFGAAVTTGFIKANDTVTFIYDGTNYQVISVIAASNNNIVVGSNKPAYPCTWIETDA